MSENFSKSQLEQMRVADLKNIAENYSIDVSGMKKADLVEAILDADDEDKQSEVSIEFDNETTDSDVENIDDIKESKSYDDQEIEDTSDEEECEACKLPVPDSSETAEPKTALVSSVSNDTKVIIKNGIAPLYNDKNCTKILSRVSGKLIVLSEFENSTKVRGFVSGYGPIVGFIRK